MTTKQKPFPWGSMKRKARFKLLEDVSIVAEVPHDVVVRAMIGLKQRRTTTKAQGTRADEVLRMYGVQDIPEPADHVQAICPVCDKEYTMYAERTNTYCSMRCGIVGLRDISFED